MTDRDAGDHTNRIAFLLHHVSKRFKMLAVGTNVDRGRISFLAGSQRSRRCSRIGIRMPNVFSLGQQIRRVTGLTPWCCATKQRRIPAKFLCPRCRYCLSIDILFRVIVMRRSNKVSKIGIAFFVVQKRKSGAWAFGVKHFFVFVNRSRLDRLPIHPVKNNQDDVFLT